MLELFSATYPYTDFHELNLDWLISKMTAIDHKLSNFVSLNTIKYADPLQWDITKQYETNTVVVDQNTGIAYLSNHPVPAGVSLSNRNYWSEIFNLDQIIGDITNNLTIRNNQGYPTFLFPVAEGDWILWNSKLYVATTDSAIGTTIIVGSNVRQSSVEELTKYYTDVVKNNLTEIIGALSDLVTSDTSSIVNAINSVLVDTTTIIGDLDNLTTTDKDSIVSAINEVVSDLNDIAYNLTTLGNNVGDLGDLITRDKTSVVNAINEIKAQVSNIKTIYVNVKDYGAKGDGVTDDTVAINNAKTVAESFTHGATLFFPAGTYLISSTIVFNHRGNALMGVSILGEGNYSSIITANNDITLIRYEGDPSIESNNGYIYGVSIHNIYLYKDPNASTTKNGIEFVYCGMVSMINVRIRYFMIAVYLSACANSTFYKVDMSANHSNMVGFDVGDRSVSNSYIACTFSASGGGASLTANTYGFNASRGNISDQNIIYFDVAGATSAIRFNGANTLDTQTGDINIIDLVCETYYGIMLYNFASHGNVNIIGGWFNCRGTRSGVFLDNCNGVKINGCTFVNNVGSGTLSGKIAINLSGNQNGTIQVTNCLIKNQIAFSGGAGGGAVMFNNNFIHIEGGITSPDTEVYINAKNSMAIGNIFRGTMLTCIRMGSNATYSLCANNVGDGGATGTAFRSEGGATTILDNNING